MDYPIIICHEMRRIWLQPLVWVVLALTFLVIALLFLVLLNNFYSHTQVKFAGLENAPGVTDSVIYPMLFWSTLAGGLMMPIFTVRSVNEEKIRQQSTLLLTAPVSCRAIIFSKLAALFSVALLFAGLNLILPATIATLVALDWGKILAGIVGMLLFHGSFTSICIYLATLNKNLIFTLLSSLGVYLLLLVLFFSASSQDSASQLFLYLSAFSHILPPLSGLITSRNIFYFIIITLLFSSLAAIHLRFKRD